MIAVSTDAYGTRRRPAMPMPPITACANAVTTTPCATLRIAAPARVDRARALVAADADREPLDAGRGRLAVRVEDGGDHHGQQEVHRQGAQAAQLADQPADDVAHVGRDALGQVALQCRVAPGRIELLADEGQAVDPVRRDGEFTVSSRRTHPVMSSTCDTIAPTASDSGMTSTSSSTTVIAVTAIQRFPHRRFCTASIKRHVAMTIIDAQTRAGRNGPMTLKDSAISPARNTTRIRIWKMSRFGGWFMGSVRRRCRARLERLDPRPMRARRGAAA